VDTCILQDYNHHHHHHHHHHRRRHFLFFTDGPESYYALKELMNGRKVLDEFTKLFDQKSSIYDITWHTVALELAGWDTERVKSKEYL
jgi:hypothetical protein